MNGMFYGATEFDQQMCWLMPVETVEEDVFNGNVCSPCNECTVVPPVAVPGCYLGGKCLNTGPIPASVDPCCDCEMIEIECVLENIGNWLGYCGGMCVSVVDYPTF